MSFAPAPATRAPTPATRAPAIGELLARQRSREACMPEIHEGMFRSLGTAVCRMLRFMCDYVAGPPTFPHEQNRAYVVRCFREYSWNDFHCVALGADARVFSVWNVLNNEAVLPAYRVDNATVALRANEGGAATSDPCFVGDVAASAPVIMGDVNERALRELLVYAHAAATEGAPPPLACPRLHSFFENLISACIEWVVDSFRQPHDIDITLGHEEKLRVARLAQRRLCGDRTQLVARARDREHCESGVCGSCLPPGDGGPRPRPPPPRLAMRPLTAEPGAPESPVLVVSDRPVQRRTALCSRGRAPRVCSPAAIAAHAQGRLAAVCSRGHARRGGVSVRAAAAAARVAKGER